VAKKRVITSRKARRSEGYPPETLEKIRERAYFIWESKGRDNRSADEDWLEAEEELKARGVI
jgi:hypothetical protein